MLIRELERQGNWLFRRRSFVPLVLLPFALLALALHRQHFTVQFPLAERIFEFVCFAVSLSGLAIRGWALGYAQPGSSGRNTREQVADHLNTSGPYAVCRHPLYLGNILIMAGVALFTKSLMFTVVAVLVYLQIYERIIAAEESFLDGKYGEPFRAWAARTSALLPRFGRWAKPDWPFSWRAAIKGEFYGFTAVVTVLFILRILDVWLTERTLRLDRVWLILFAVTLFLFVILRFLRKHTRVFERNQEVTVG